MRTVFVTKYALSTGIKECDVDDHHSSFSDRMIYVKWPGGINDVAGFSRADCHEDIASARASAEAMRKAKIASLLKQIARLEKLSFES